MVGTGESAASFPDAPLYHYGSYEKKAFVTLAKRHGKGEEAAKQLVNVAYSVYGKVYFPVRSNGLKSLGRFLGAVWTDPQASGLQSLVWRHRWDATRDERCRESLLQYNREDCEAVRLLVDRLDRIRRDAATDPAIEFARRPKRYATETGQAIHGRFERILKSAEEGSAGRGIRICEQEQGAAGPRKRGARSGHRTFQRIVPARGVRTVTLPVREECPKGHVGLVTRGLAGEKIVTDLVFTRNGCRKTVTQYVGPKAYCPKCHREYVPADLDLLGQQMFGHAFQA